MNTFIRNTLYELLTPEGFRNFDGLHSINNETLRVFNNERLLIEASAKHPVLTPVGFKTLQELQVGDILITRTGKCSVTHIERGAEYALYDPINVAHPEREFYTGDIISHNCDFMGSANTLISPWKLAQLSYAEPVEVRLDKKNNGLKIYRKPVTRKPNADPEKEEDPHVYVILVDVGQGQEQDYSVAQVIDISENPFRQVATYRDNTIKPTQFAPVLRDIGRFYNSAFMLLEINAEGFSVADILSTELEYENIIQVFPHPKKGQMLSSGFNPRARLGLRVTEATKRIGCTGLKSLVENDRLLVVDYETMREMTTFVAKMNKNNSAAKTYEAEVGNHDDCIMPLVLLGWLTLQSGFENYVGLSMRQLLTEGHDQLTTELPFVGILGDGELPPAPQPTGYGWDVVDDPSFWKEDTDANWLK